MARTTSQIQRETVKFSLFGLSVRSVDSPRDVTANVILDIVASIRRNVKPRRHVGLPVGCRPTA